MFSSLATYPRFPQVKMVSIQRLPTVQRLIAYLLNASLNFEESHTQYSAFSIYPLKPPKEHTIQPTCGEVTSQVRRIKDAVKD